MKRVMTIMLTAVAVVGITVVVRNNLTDGNHLQSAYAGEAKLPICPIMGEPINLAVSTETKDGPVYFCCKGCIKKYHEESAKYAGDVDKQRKALGALPKVQVKCPVTGEPADPKVYTEHNGKKVSFCSKGCIKKYTNDSSKYAAALANSYTHQTVCPVMDEPINPLSFSELPSGETVYYCCKGCIKKFMGSPENYVSKLQVQGYSISAKKIKAATKKHDDSHDGHDHGDHEGHGHDDHDH